jgi:hypothetical protein
MRIISKVKNNAPIFILLFFILTSSSVTAQINKLNSLLKDTTDYNFNKPAIFRAGIHFPMGLQPFVSGEVKLLKRLTLNMQLGASLDNSRAEWVVTDPVELADSDKISVSGFISPELRYYFLPLGRIKKTNRPLFGFSGAYLALKYFASTPSTKRNSAATYSFENVSAWQLNIGSQIQFKPHFFLGTFAGFVIGKNPIDDNKPNVIPLLQFGFTVGYVF